MEIILLGNIRKIGVLGQTVNVKPGFARNYLIPQGKGVYATEANIKKFEQRRAELEKIAAEKMQQTLERQKTINALPVMTLTAKAGEEGKLFGSIGTREIADALKKAGSDVEKREIRLDEGALRLVGEYDITIDLEHDVTATVKIKVVAEG